MSEMDRSVSYLRSDFDGFLFASIGDDNGNSDMPLSVLSALARQNFDPWEEAARLACVPTENAIHSLTALIAALPNGRSPRLDPGVIAARLIALLPHRAVPVERARMPQPSVGTAAHVWPTKYIIGYLLFMLFLLGTQWIVANHLVAAPATAAAQPVSGSVVSQAPSKNADR
jgi:hypothetical protein